jgi:hypothetical protein
MNVYSYAHVVPETAPFRGARDLLGAAECFLFDQPGAEAALSLKGMATRCKSGLSFPAMNFLASITSRPDVGHIPFLANAYRG